MKEPILPCWTPGKPPPPLKLRMNTWASDGTAKVVEYEAPLSKPRLYRYLDKYAIANGEPWCCSYAGMCARGSTMEGAYLALKRHFEQMRELRLQQMRTPTLQGYA